MPPVSPSQNRLPRDASSSNRIARNRWPIWVAGALVALSGIWLLSGRGALGRDNWFIAPRRVWWPINVWLLPLAVLGLFGGLALLSIYDRFRRAKTRREQKTSVRLCLFALMMLALCWPWAALGPTTGGANGASNLIAATWSDVANGYFSQAYRVSDARRFTRDYPTQQQTGYAMTQAHVATHPPGATLFYFAARRVFEASPALQNVFTTIHQNLTGASLHESADLARDVVFVSTRIRPTLPDSAAPAALWCAFLLSLCVALTVPAVYLLGAGTRKDSDESEQTNDANANDANRVEARGLMAAALFVLAPSVGLFAFTLDALICCLAAWTVVLAARRLNGGGAWNMIVSGVLMALNSFLSFGALAIGAVVVLAFAVHFGVPMLNRRDAKSVSSGSAEIVRRPSTMPRPIFDLVCCALGFFAAWLVMCALLPMQPFAIFTNAMQAHHAATGNRNRWGWAWLNLVVFAFFCGWPLVVALAARIAKTKTVESKSRIATDGASKALGWATLGALLLLSVSGNVRGEAERLWMFALPPLCAFAAAAFAPGELSHHIVVPRDVMRHEYSCLGALLFLQTVQTVVMTGALAPLVRPF